MNQSSLRVMRVAPCDTDLFAVPSTGFVFLQPFSLEHDPDRAFYDRKPLVQDHDHSAPAIGEKKADSIKFTLDARGHKAGGFGSGSVAVEGEAGLLLKSTFGTQVLDTGGTVGSSASETSIPQTAGTFTAGAFAGFVDPATGLYHARQVRATGATLTLCRALPFTPALAAVAYASAAYHYAVGVHPHVFLDVEHYDPEGAAQNARFQYLGATGKWSLSGTAALAKLQHQFEFQALDWIEASGASMGSPTYPAGIPEAGPFVRNTRAWIDATQQDVLDLSYDPAFDVRAKVSTNHNGKSKFFTAGYGGILKVKVYEDDGAKALRTKRDANTPIDFLAEWTDGGPGNSFALAVPKAFVKSVKFADENGLDAWEVTLEVARNTLGLPAMSFGVL